MRFRRSRTRSLSALLALLVALYLYVRPRAVPGPALAPIPSTTNSNNNAPQPLDHPFSRGCDSHHDEDSAHRANATFVFLCRESELPDVLHTLGSVEQHFNDRFHYPFVFLSDTGFSVEFQAAIREKVPASNVTFASIPAEHWGYPEWVDRERARAAFKRMKDDGVPYGDKESYHHMCRYYSGFFYKHEALKPYKWYWRLEPAVDFFCKLTYDPFLAMERHNKVYGFTMSIWEVGSTVPSLAWKISQHYDLDPAIRPMMHAFIERKVPSVFSWALHKLAGSRFHGYSRNGMMWNMCHFWSNFEIADLDWFRGREYQEFFDVLDRDGGIYYERWGDAAIHSLAVGVLLKPEQVHYFGDNMGYRHDDLLSCPWDDKELGNPGCECNSCIAKVNVRIPKNTCVRAYQRAVQWSPWPQLARGTS